MSSQDEAAARPMAELLISAMKDTLGDDERRISHALQVLQYARDMVAADGAGEPASPEVVEAAAILHDIGIQEAERTHGSAAGRYQEIEGPPIARRLMEDAGLPEETIEHVCRIVGSHHTAGDMDTPEFRIVWDADWLVNIPEEYPDHTTEQLGRLIERVFRTEAGRQIAREIFLGTSAEERGSPT
jgi:HD superfamily phosphodiesterase